MRPRGSTTNPPNRFEALRYVPSAAEAAALAEANPETRLLSDPSRTIVATNNSPDVGFDASVNPYRGCEHACSYCLAPETPVLFGDLTGGRSARRASATCWSASTSTRRADRRGSCGRRACSGSGDRASRRCDSSPRRRRS